MNILDLFIDNGIQVTKTGGGKYKCVCPSCGSDTTDYGGLIINPKDNTCFCFGSNKWFDFYETYGLIKGEIKCIEGNDPQEK